MTGNPTTSLLDRDGLDAPVMTSAARGRTAVGTAVGDTADHTQEAAALHDELAVRLLRQTKGLGAMTSVTSMAAALPADYRERLMRIAHEVSFEAGTRLFEEGRRADRFWIVRTGTVALDLHVPGRRAAVIDSLGHGELVGWSWHFTPHVWQLGAEAVTPVRAHEFDAVTVRAMCAQDPEFGQAIAVWVGRVLAHRLHAARTRLLDLYAPYGSGSAS